MELHLPTDPREMHDAIAGAVMADPVANTLLGSMLDGPVERLWCAMDPDRPGVLAVRSAARFPVVLTPGWTPADAPALAEVISEVPALRAVSGGVEVVEAVADAVAQRTGRDVSDRLAERLFRLDSLDEPRGIPGWSRTTGPRDRALLNEWIVAFTQEVHAPQADPRIIVDRLIENESPLGRLWLDSSGRPVALAARRAASGGCARVGPVFTSPAERGHGYAAAVTAAVTREILEGGAVAVLFTDASDPGPNRLYQRLGYRPVRDLAQIFLT
ncbi:MAG: GNAT family N-acetyltransferase [bacterium]